MRLCQIEIFPIKSLDGVAVEEARITPGGILEHDRVYAIMDRDGKVVNGKRTARVHQLRCAFDPLIKEVRLWPGGSSPAITSEASLQAIQQWYPELALESVRRRFRANLELGGGAAFCEDQLYGAADEPKPFQIGTVNILGHNPCQRCVVPTRDPVSGEAVPEFQKKFMRLRREHLPAWAGVERFNHFYRFAVNTSVPATEAGKRLRVGDPVVF